MTLSVRSASALVSTTTSLPHWTGISPRWLQRLLPWVEVPGGIYTLNRVIQGPTTLSEHKEGTRLRTTFADYEGKPRDITLSLVEAVLEMHTRVPHLLSYPHDQLGQQLRLAREAVKEEQERLLLGSRDFGLLHGAPASQRLDAGGRPPTPEDFDELLSVVWKNPAFFVCHPKVIAEFRRQCTARGLNLEAVELFAEPFTAWRGVPLIPSDKLPLGPGGKGERETQVLLLRVGEDVQGVIGLRAGHGAPQGVVVQAMGTDQAGVSTHLLSCYFSLAVLTEDAVGVLEGVKV